MTAELRCLLFALLCVVSSLLVIEAWVLGLDGCKAQFNSLIE